MLLKQQPIDLEGKVFANGLGDWGLILSQVIPKTQKMVLDTSLLNTQHYKVKWSNPEKGVAPYPTHWFGNSYTLVW